MAVYFTQLLLKRQKALYKGLARTVREIVNPLCVENVTRIILVLVPFSTHIQEVSMFIEKKILDLRKSSVKMVI